MNTFSSGRATGYGHPPKKWLHFITENGAFPICFSLKHCHHQIAKYHFMGM